MPKKRMDSFEQQEAKLAYVDREFMLARTPFSGLTSLQELTKVHKYADGHFIQACLRVLRKMRAAARPELTTARWKRRASTLTVDYITTRRAVDQMLAMASLEAVSIRGAGGRVSRRFVRFDRHLDVLRMMGFSAVEASLAMHQNVPMLNRTVNFRMVQGSADRGSLCNGRTRDCNAKALGNCNEDRLRQACVALEQCWPKPRDKQ